MQQITLPHKQLMLKGEINRPLVQHGGLRWTEQVSRRLWRLWIKHIGWTLSRRMTFSTWVKRMTNINSFPKKMITGEKCAVIIICLYISNCLLMTLVMLNEEKKNPLKSLKDTFKE